MLVYYMPSEKNAGLTKNLDTSQKSPARLRSAYSSDTRREAWYTDF